MSTRRNFRGIAYGLLGSFVSRNNDVGGYWAIGKLYLFTALCGSQEIRINLRNGHIVPPKSEFLRMSRKYSRLLFEHMERLGLPDTYLKIASIELKLPSNESQANPAGAHRLFCVVRITDDRDRTYVCEESVWCRKHNPEQEQKSTREY
jgi:hypothetical protein